MRDMSTRGKDRSVTDPELIQAVKSHPDPAVKARELSEQLGLSSTRISQLLNELEEDGMVMKKKFGSGYGWWVPKRID